MLGSIAGSIFSSVASSAIGSMFGGGGGEGGGGPDMAALMAQNAFRDARQVAKQSRMGELEKAGQFGSTFMDPREKVQAQEEDTKPIQEILRELTGLSEKEQVDYVNNFHNNLPEETKQTFLDSAIQKAIDEDDIEFADSLIENDDIFFRHDDDSDVGSGVSKPKAMSPGAYWDLVDSEII
jgi:hypothetical protein